MWSESVELITSDFCQVTRFSLKIVSESFAKQIEGLLYTLPLGGEGLG